MPPSPGACKLIARLDRGAIPRHPDGRPWLPPGLAPDAPEAEVVRALAAAWGTPAWVLALAGRVAAELGVAEDWARCPTGGGTRGSRPRARRRSTCRRSLSSRAPV